MEEMNSLIYHGCALARDLELNLPNLANQPIDLARSCDEIASVFGSARDRLNSTILLLEFQQQEWLRYRSVDLLQPQVVVPEDPKGTFDIHGVPPESSRMEEMEQPRGGGEDASGSGRASSSFQRPRRRKDDANKRTIRVPAPRMGNTEIPPEDGHTWRKYGQKEILGSRFPRGYYRCTHQKLYYCNAKKQVQRLDDDPFTFEVTYRGEHACTMSSTAPSVPPTSAEVVQTMAQQGTTIQPQGSQGPPISVPLGRWLTMDISNRNIGVAGTSSNRMVGSGGADPSTVRFHRENEYQPVADLADAMFNSGSSSSNSMDIIFSTMEDKWEAGDKMN
ncbi:hypothetical protein RJ639_009956 [Escallonia herrerae]|uniref:WRKY domain-containing protein n=1 Tax=Escallonia herrerae TaxID=1293975 RepID=A0AA89ATU5_9ASTE|nr:hypothetical protein RJ639_009956 [Escallonia herrerae]